MLRPVLKILSCLAGPQQHLRLVFPWQRLRERQAAAGSRQGRPEKGPKRPLQPHPGAGMPSSMVPTKLRGSRCLLALTISGPPSLTSESHSTCPQAPLQPEPAWDTHNFLYMAPRWILGLQRLTRRTSRSRPDLWVGLDPKPQNFSPSAPSPQVSHCHPPGTRLGSLTCD